MAKEKHFVKACSCTPRGGLSIVDLQMLNQIVRDAEASIAREKNARKMAQRALALGDICMASGCPARAISLKPTRALITLSQKWKASPWANASTKPGTSWVIAKWPPGQGTCARNTATCGSTGTTKRCREAYARVASSLEFSV